MAFIYRRSTWLFLLVLLLCWLFIRLDLAPASVNEHPADSAFQVSSALAHLRQITREPHSLGTPANDGVRDYIISACKSLGLDVTLLPFQVAVPEFRGLVVARGTNIAATLHGKSSTGKKKILVMAHYDSEPNSLGAGDDGSACAAMLESIRALRAGTPLPADVLFLFTNGEEDGLLGAEAFSRDSAQLKDIGFLLNFDGRGDKGKCMMFRTSANNDWILREYAHSEIHHGTGSLYSELFNLLPNNTDFSPFLKTGIPGLDFAFAEGFTAYHNRTDNVDNIGKDMMQEQGDNMLGSIRHFARIDVDEPPGTSGHTTYFDLIGNVLIRYPPSVNLLLLLLTNALVIFALAFGIVRRKIKLGHAALGLLVFPITQVILYFLASWTLDAIRTIWPLYLGYYPNSYNAYYFYLTLAAEEVAIFAFCYMWPLRRLSMPSLFIAILIVQTVLLDFSYRFIPAGTYFLYFPILGSAAIFPFLVRDKVRKTALLIGALPALLFLAPLIYSMAELFDLQPEAAMLGPMMALLLGLLMPLLSLTIRETRWLIPVTSIVVMVVAAALGVFHGHYSHEKPFKTDLRYVLRPDQHESWWVSREIKADRWNRTFFTQPAIRPSTYWYPVASARPASELANAAPYLDLPAPSLLLTKDTTIAGHRQLYVHCQPASGTTTIHISFTADHPADNLRLATRMTSGASDASFSGPLGWLEYDAPPDTGFDLVITCQPHVPFTIDLTGRTMGIPAATGFHGYPDDVIPTAAAFANTTMVQRSYIFR